MTISEAILKLMELAKRSNMTFGELLEWIYTILNLIELAKRSSMTFGELLEWISRNDREDEILPWEE